MNLIKEITDEKELKKELKGTGVKILFFRTGWCEACSLQSKMLCELANECSFRIKVLKIDVDENEKIAKGYGVKVLPTTITVINGEIVSRLEGLTSKGDIAEILIKLM